MEWVIIAAVPLLLIAWRYLWATSKPPRRHVMTDVRGAMADRLQVLATEARDNNHHRGAQHLEYQARWLRTRPDVGGDDVPDALDVTQERHVRFAAAVWEDYGSFLAEIDEAADADRSMREIDLPFTKEGITAALQLLLDIGEGRASCAIIDGRSIEQDAIDTMHRAMARLDDFI